MGIKGHTVGGVHGNLLAQGAAAEDSALLFNGRS